MSTEESPQEHALRELEAYMVPITEHANVVGGQIQSNVEQLRRSIQEELEKFQPQEPVQEEQEVATNTAEEQQPTPEEQRQQRYLKWAIRTCGGDISSFEDAVQAVCGQVEKQAKKMAGQRNIDGTGFNSKTFQKAVLRKLPGIMGTFDPEGSKQPSQYLNEELPAAINEILGKK